MQAAITPTIRAAAEPERSNRGAMTFSSSMAVHSRLRLALVLILFVILSGCGSNVPEAPPTPQSSIPQPSSDQPSTARPEGQLAPRLANAVNDAGAFVHLEALQKIANENGGHRASPSPGYE